MVRTSRSMGGKTYSKSSSTSSGSSSSIDTNYQLRAGESISDYTSRVADYNYSKGSVGAAEAQAGVLESYNKNFGNLDQNIIDSSILTPSSSIIIPPPPGPGNLGTKVMTQLGAYSVPSPATEQDDSSLKSLLKNIAEPPSSEKIYRDLEKQTQIREKEALVSNLQNQINAITAKAQADKLSLEGQGRGVTDVIIGGQQAKIDREAAIQSLPIAAQLSAAQGDLASARDHLQTLFQIRMQDAENRVNYRNKVAELVFNYANDKQKELLADRRTRDNRQFDLLRDNISYARDLATAAIENGQSSLAASIMRLDPNSSTYARDLAGYAGSIQPKADSGGSGTEAERRASSIATLKNLISSGQPLSNGNLPVDQNGYLTPEAWNVFINEAPSEGLSRQDFIKEFGNYVYVDRTKEGVLSIPLSYKLTESEKKLILGELEGA